MCRVVHVSMYDPEGDGPGRMARKYDEPLHRFRELVEQGCAVYRLGPVLNRREHLAVFIGWFMEFARLARDLVGTNLRDCLHWRSLYDNPQPLIVAASNLYQVNRRTLVQLREAYYAIREDIRPFLEEVWPHDQDLSQSERFEDRLAIVERMVKLWEDGQYVGWPS